MSFSYDPKDAEVCLNAGVYEAVIVRAESRISKAGNEMLVVTWKVFGPENEKFLSDYITHKGLWRLKRICKVANIDFDTGQLEPDSLVNVGASLTLKVENDDYGDKNTIQKYEAITGVTASPKNDKPDGEIPF